MLDAMGIREILISYFRGLDSMFMGMKGLTNPWWEIKTLKRKCYKQLKNVPALWTTKQRYVYVPKIKTK